MLKQALSLMNMQESINVSKIEYMYKSNNMFFFLTKEPTCLVSRSLMRKIEEKREQEEGTRVMKQIEKDE